MSLEIVKQQIAAKGFAIVQRVYYSNNKRRMVVGKTNTTTLGLSA